MRLRRLALPLFACAALFAQPQTALDRYVAAKDSVYGWKLVKTIPGEGVRTDVLELTSQTWRTEKDVDRPIWKHWLSITRPDKVAIEHSPPVYRRWKERRPRACQIEPALGPHRH